MCAPMNTVQAAQQAAQSAAHSLEHQLTVKRNHLKHMCTLLCTCIHTHAHMYCTCAFTHVYNPCAGGAAGGPVRSSQPGSPALSDGQRGARARHAPGCSHQPAAGRAADERGTAGSGVRCALLAVYKHAVCISCMWSLACVVCMSSSVSGSGSYHPAAGRAADERGTAGSGVRCALLAVYKHAPCISCGVSLFSKSEHRCVP